MEEEKSAFYYARKQVFEDLKSIKSVIFESVLRSKEKTKELEEELTNIIMRKE